MTPLEIIRDETAGLVEQFFYFGGLGIGIASGVYALHRGWVYVRSFF